MDSVMDFVNISAIYHAIQERQPPHYQMIKNSKREKNYFRFCCSLIILNAKSVNFLNSA